MRKWLFYIVIDMQSDRTTSGLVTKCTVRLEGNMAILQNDNKYVSIVHFEITINVILKRK